jgi:mono/diheme cytochrome c family protein
MMHRALKIGVLLLLCGNAYPAFGQRDSTEIFESGKAVFNTYCLPCHGVHQEKLGPMLASITKKRSDEWLIAFIRNSQEVILSGDAYAHFLFEQYNQVVMPSFRQLPERKIKDVLLYIEKESVSPSEEVTPRLEVNQAYSNQHILRGKVLFDEQCATCHFIGKEGEGPSLGSVTKRRPPAWLIPFIKNSQRVIQEGDAYAVHLFNSYEQKIMPPFDFLAQDDIGAILDYINFISASPPHIAGVNGRKAQEWTSRPASPVSAESIAEEQEKGSSFLKILFMVLSAIGALVHIYIVAKLYRYLTKGS